MTTLTLVNAFKGNLGKKLFNLETDTFKVMLVNSGVDVNDDAKSDLTEIAAGNGYVAGGNTLINVTWTETTPGIWTFACSDFSFLAVGGTIGPFRYFVLYDDTSASDLLIGFYDYGVSISLSEGNPLNANVPPEGLFSIQGV
jgi:hypothetical protein